MRRALVVAVLLATLDGSAALAHETGGSNGGSDVSLPVLLGGFAIISAGLVARAKTTNTFARWIPVVAGAALAVSSLFLGGDDGNARPDVHLAIMEPAARSTVAAREPIAVRVNVDGPIASGPQDREGGHLHLAVDGRLQQMPYATTAEVTLEPGHHVITIEYVDNEHLSYDPPIQHAVQVTAAGADTHSPRRED